MYLKYKKQGFTLLEVIASTLIIAAMAAGMFGAFVGAQSIFNRARHRIQAFHFAREVQERLRANYTYTSPAMNPSVQKNGSEIGFNVRGEMASLGTTVTYDVSEPQVDGYKEVTVRVSWTEASL